MGKHTAAEANCNALQSRTALGRAEQNGSWERWANEETNDERIHKKGMNSMYYLWMKI